MPAYALIINRGFWIKHENDIHKQIPAVSWFEISKLESYTLKVCIVQKLLFVIRPEAGL